MKKIISILLLCAMLLPSVACSSDTDKKKPADTTAAQTTASNVITNDVEPIDEDLEALDYGDEKVVILQRECTNESAAGNYQYTNELFAEELNSDPINDAIYNRNMAIEELLGIELIEESDRNGHTGIQQKMTIMVNAGDTTYDIVSGSAAWATPMILQGYAYNLNDNGIDTYLDTTKPWWPQYWIEEAEIDEKLYCITGGPALSLSRLMVVFFYNKTMGEAHGIENLYDVVNDGRWTIDYVANMVSSIYRDLNGNDLRDPEDEYGIAIDDYDNVDIFWSGFDMKYITKNSDGVIEFNPSSKEKIVNSFEKVYGLIFENTGSMFYRDPDFEDDYSSYYDRSANSFTSGSVLLAPLHLQYAETSAFRNMQDSYGILPTPKYDESQKNYYSYVHDQYSIFMVPTTVKDPEMSGAVLEAMAYESYKTLMPAYYEVTLKGRYANDPESRAMLDMISSNVMMDTAIIYGGFFNYPCAGILRGNMEYGNTSCVSEYESTARLIDKVIKAVRNELGKLDY